MIILAYQALDTRIDSESINLIILLLKGKRFKTNCQNWYTYSNFKLMYDNITQKIVDTSIAIELDTLIQKDKARKICAKKNTYCFKVTHNINDSNYFLIANEVRRNISQKGNRSIRGKILIYK